MTATRRLVLRTQRLLMEPMRREDCSDLYQAVVSQETVMRRLATGKSGSRADAGAMCEQHVVHWDQQATATLAVRDAVAHAFLGRVGCVIGPSSASISDSPSIHGFRDEG